MHPQPHSPFVILHHPLSSFIFISSLHIFSINRICLDYIAFIYSLIDFWHAVNITWLSGIYRDCTFHNCRASHTGDAPRVGVVAQNVARLLCCCCCCCCCCCTCCCFCCCCCCCGCCCCCCPCSFFSVSWRTAKSCRPQKWDSESKLLQ